MTTKNNATPFAITLFIICSIVYCVNNNCACSDELSYSLLKEEFEKVKGDSQSPADFHKFLAIFGKYRSRLSREEKLNAIRLFQESQHPLMDRKQLLSLVVERDARLMSYEISYHVTTEEFSDQRKVNTEVTEFLTKHDGDNYYLQKTPVSIVTKGNKNVTKGNKKPKIGTYVESLSKGIRRTYDGSVRQGGILQSNVIDSYYDPDGIIANAMLIGAQPVQPHPLYNLQRLLEREEVIVLEGIYKKNGEDCLKVVMGIFTFYLAPAKGFAVVCTEQEVAPNDRRREISSQNDGHLVYQRNNYYLQGFQGNLWLPRRIEQTWFSPETGRRIKRVVAEVTELKVNEPINTQSFEDIFPIGTVVIDGISKKSFMISDTPGIGKTLTEITAQNERVKSKSFRYLNYLIVANLAFLLFFAAVWVIRRRHSARNRQN